MIFPSARPGQSGLGAGGQSEQQIPALSSPYCIYPFKASLLREHLVNCKYKNQTATTNMDRNKLSSGDHYITHQHQKHRKYKKKYPARPEIYYM